MSGLHEIRQVLHSLNLRMLAMPRTQWGVWTVGQYAVDVHALNHQTESDSEIVVHRDVAAAEVVVAEEVEEAVAEVADHSIPRIVATSVASVDTTLEIVPDTAVEVVDAGS